MIEVYGGVFRCPNCVLTWYDDATGGACRPVGEGVVFAAVADSWLLCECGYPFRVFAAGDAVTLHPRSR